MADNPPGRWFTIGGAGGFKALISGILLAIFPYSGGTLASLQAAIVSSARISFAMGRDRVIPSWFEAVSEKYRTPWNATILLGLLNIVFL
jgi:amino acid transporter